MQQEQLRRSKRTTQRREHLNYSPGDSSDSSFSHVPKQTSRQTTEHTLPFDTVPSSSTALMTSTQATIATQTAQDNLITTSFHSKSIPSFAETQLLSVYYLNQNITNQPKTTTSIQDSCIFVERQERQPIRFRATYDPSASTKSTQTSPPVSLRQLSTHGSTLIVDANQQPTDSNNRLYEQRLRIHSGSQRLANNPSFASESNELLSPSELVEESRYSYEEYIIHVDNNQEQKTQVFSSSPTSTSSVTTIIAQPPSPPPPPLNTTRTVKTMLHPEELDSDRTSRLSGDEIITNSSASSMSGSFTNQDWPAATNTSSRPVYNTTIVNTREPVANETARITSWPPIPYDLQSGDNQLETSFILDESDEQRRPSRVQFAEQLVRVIPVSATNSLSEESATSAPPSSTIIAPAITPRTSTNRTNAYEQGEQQMNVDVDDDDMTTTTTTSTSSNREQIPGRLQRTSGLVNLNEVIMTRPTTAPPPPPPLPPVSAPSSSSSTTKTTSSSSGVDPRLVRDQLKRLDYQLVVDTRHPINQSKWVKDHMEAAGAETTTTTSTAGRVDALRSLFEQQSGRSSDSSTLNSPTGQIRRTEPEERPSRHGDEIRFRVKEPKTPTVFHAEPAQIIQRTKQSNTASNVVAPLTWEDLVGVQEEHEHHQQQQRRPQTLPSPFELNEIQQITGRRIQSIDDIGYYSNDGFTWIWEETFWFSLTPGQRDQLKRLLQQSRSRQDSGDTQINEHSDRSAYQGDSEDNTPRLNPSNRQGIRSQNSSQENLFPSSLIDELKQSKSTGTHPGSTVSVTGAGAWQQQQQKQFSTSSGIGKYTEASTIHESQPSVSVFGSTPTATYTRIGSQESIASSTAQQQTTTNKKAESQMTIIESGYSSADEPQQRTSQFRPNSSTIVEEPSTAHHIDTRSGVAGFVGGPGTLILSSNDIQLRDQPIYENLRPEARQQMHESDLDPLSYEQFIYDYFSTYARRLRSDDGTLILLIDGQQIQMSHIRLPSNANLTLAKNVYLDAIDEYPPPFETESDQLVIFIHGEPIVLPADRWLVYKRKYQKAQWINKLDRVNRHIPLQLMAMIEEWLAGHTTFSLDAHEMNVDGLNIPLTGNSGSRVLDLYQIRQLQPNQSYYWSEILKYLIRTGYVSFDADEQMIRIAQSELDVRRVLAAPASPSPELVDRLASLLRLLDSIHFDNSNGTLILGDNFVIANNYIRSLLEKQAEGQVLNANELASLLLRICAYEEDDDGQSLVLTLDDQILQLTPPPLVQDQVEEEEEDEEEEDNDADETFVRWLSDNVRWSSEQGRVFLLRYQAMPNYLVQITGQDGFRLSNLLHRQALQLDDILQWHEKHVQIDRTENSLRMVIKANNSIEIVNLPLPENETNRGKVNEERKKSTNQKARNSFDEEEKNLVFFIPLHQQTLSDSEQAAQEEEEEKEKEKDYHYQHSTPPPLFQREEQKKIKTDDDNDDGRERALLLQSIASLLHFVNANGSDVGTLELIQGRRLRLSLTGNSPLTQQQQHIEFNEDDTKTLYETLDLDIDACTQQLVDHIFDRIQFDNEHQELIIHYRNQMLALKNLKQKLFQPTAKKLRLTSKTAATESSLTRPIDEEQVNVLTQWLDQLNRQQLINITEQNDIVVLPNGEDDQEQQIFINHEDVDKYMENKVNNAKAGEAAEVIGMPDIARILLLFNYAQYADGKLSFGDQNIALDRNELIWLKSIIRGVRPDRENRETEVDLFDGEHTQVLRIPYEHMPSTNDHRRVADYLFQNGHIRYDIDTGNYAYRYVPPDIPLDEDVEAAERAGQRQLLTSHIRHIHVDEANEQIELEFLHDPTHRLLLPTRWYRQAASYNFDRAYIIDMLLANGGVIDQDTFTYNGQTYSLQVPPVLSTSSSTANLQTLKLSSKHKQEVVERYVELVHQQDGIKRDNTNDLLLLENLSDGSQLYLTAEHSQFVQKHKFKRADVTRLLNKHGQIKQDEFGNWLLYYNNQYVQIPATIIPEAIKNSVPAQNKASTQRSARQTSSATEEEDAEFRASLARESQLEFFERYHGTIDYMYRNGLITTNKRSKLVQLHFSNQTLVIPIEQLRSFIDARVFVSAAENTLPFESRQLSQWLLENSETISNTRQGYIQLTHKSKTYDFPLINPNLRPPESQSALSTIVKRFGLTSRSITLLSKVNLTSSQNQIRCAQHLLAKLDEFDGINIDNDSRTLILSMTPDNKEQLIIKNPVLPVTKQSLVDYLVRHGRFTLNAAGDDIEYRQSDNGRIYRFRSYIRDWDEALGETNEERIVRVLGEILSLNGRFLQRSDRQIIVSLRNGDRFVIPKDVGAQLLGPVNGQTIAELLVRYADDIHEEQDGKYLVIGLDDQVLRLPQQRQLMSGKQQPTSSTTGTKTPVDPKLKLLFPFNKSLRQIQKTPSTTTLNTQPADASNGYAMDPLLMLANYIYRAGSIYQDDLRRLVIKMNEDEIVIPRIEAVNAIETINTSPHRTGTIIARLIDRIGKVQSNKAGGLIITIGRSSFELSKELLDRSNQLHREAIDIENDLPVDDQDILQSGLNGSLGLIGRHSRLQNGPPLLPLLRQSKSVGSLSTSAVGHPWFTDDQQMLYSKDGRGDARYLNLDNYSLAWQKEAHKHGVNCEVRALHNVAPYLDVLGYVENDPKKAVTINELTRVHPEMLSRGKLNDVPYLTQLANDRAQVQTKLCPKPRILVIPDDETMLSSNRQTRFYVQYMYEHNAVLGADPAYVMMLPSRYPVKPTQPQLIAPHHYRDIALRDAPVYVHKKDEGEVYHENLAQYLSTEHPDVSPGTVRRMLKFSKRDEYLAYLRDKMPAADAERLVRESEEPPGEATSRYVNVATRIGGDGFLRGLDRRAENDEELDDDFEEQLTENDNRRRIVSPRTYYNTQNGARNVYEERRPIVYDNRSNSSLQPPSTGGGLKVVERSPSTSSLGSDMLIANTFPSRRSVLGNAPSANIPASRNDTTRATINSLSSLTDENYGRPVVRGRTGNTSAGQSSTSPEKTVTLPRSATLTGQSNDGESDGRTTVLRSSSAVAKVVTSKSDTLKSTTSSSAASSREPPSAAASSSSVVRAQSLVSPTRVSGSKGGGDEAKKEKKSKFRTPSFLKKRKEKKEAINKEKS